MIGGVDEIISTRRLDHIVAPSQSSRQVKTIELCVSRFDDDTKIHSLTCTLYLISEKMYKIWPIQMKT